MSLPKFQSNSKDFMLMQTQWASQLNPLLANPIVSGSILKSVKLSNGNNTINHKQGHPLNGYIVVGMHGSYAQIYDTTSPNPELTLVLNSSAPTMVDLYVF